MYHLYGQCRRFPHAQALRLCGACDLSGSVFAHSSTLKGITTIGRTNVTITKIQPRRVTPPLPRLERNALPDDVLVPEQFFALAHHSAVHWSGARWLLFAVLQDAVACWFRYRHVRSTRGRRLFRQTHEWFCAEDRHWLFAFERICEHLELDPDYIRRGLTHWQLSEPKWRTPLLWAQPIFGPRHLSFVRS
jgi:hypothetical protein